METKIPEKLWHITDSLNLLSIMDEGLTAAWGNYGSSDMNTACRFIAIRRVLNPDITWVAIEFETKGLNVELSTDHNPAFFGTEDSWVVWEPVPASAIIGAYELEFNEETEEQAQ